MNKAESKWKSGECQSCLILVEVYFGGELFQKAAQFPHVLITKELRFLGPGGKEISVQGSNFMIVYMGKNLAKFKVTFGQIGIIPGINSWASESPAFSMDQYVVTFANRILQTNRVTISIHQNSLTKV